MRRKLTWVALLGGAIAVTVHYSGQALATPAAGFLGTTLAVGRFGEIDVFNYAVPANEQQEGHKNNVSLSLQRTKGLSDVYVQNNVWAPGGSTGWHTHPGHSLIIVTEGTVTAYDGDDPECKPREFTKGMGFVDAGGEHVHIIRNEGPVEARTIAVQLIPADATRRIDVDSPGNCVF